MDNKQEKAKELNLEQMEKVSGGMDVPSGIFDSIICRCGAEARSTGLTDETGRFEIFRCVNGHEFTVYGW